MAAGHNTGALTRDGAICVGGAEWRPHTDIADAARLAVELRMLTDTMASMVDVYGPSRYTNQRIPHDGTQADAERAYCEAVTLCAAAVGERMRGAS